jgi:hypothetical protein
MIPRKRTFRIVAAAVAISMLSVGAPAAAADMHTGKVSLPIAAWGKTKIQTIDINITTADNFTAPTKAHAGWITFRVTSPEAGYHALQVMRVNPGHTLDQVLQDFTMGLSGDLNDTAAGARNLVRDATLMGGVVTSSYAAQSISIPMTPGTYYLFDQNEIGGTTPVHVHTLKVVGHMNWSGMPAFSSVIGAYIDSDDMPRFAAPTSFQADSSFLVFAQGDELHEAVFRPILSNVDDQYITTYYINLDAGLPHAPSPWTDVQHGVQAMSPGQFAVFHMDLPPGHYALLCLVPDDTNGRPHSHMGMHQVVDLH